MNTISSLLVLLAFTTVSWSSAFSLSSSPLVDKPPPTKEEVHAKTSSSSSSSSSSSRALRSILGEQSTDHFFDKVWQKYPQVYRMKTAAKEDDIDSDNPLYNQVDMGIPGIVRALENACETFLTPPSPEWQVMLPMVFNRNKQSLSLNELAPLYGNNLFAAYLDGCSVVMNHVDKLSPETAALCEDLQKTFPYAYANAYLTPPASQAVPAHADDRDVFVIQVYGSKAWKVYEDVPIQYPYTHEQVGKNDMPVPPSVLSGPCIVDTVLSPGDVLYIPRGFVHEACTHAQQIEEDHQPSFHITIALATFDWALSGLLATAVRKTLDDMPEMRMAVPVEFGMRDFDGISFDQKQSLERQVEHALEQVRQEVTTKAINDYLKQKYEWHASQSRPGRLMRIAAAAEEEEANNADTDSDKSTVGLEAAKGLTMSTLIRASTPEESEVIFSRPKRYVREESADALLSILDALQSDPSKTLPINQLPTLLSDKCDSYICELTLLSFVRISIERGEMSVVR